VTNFTSFEFTFSLKKVYLFYFYKTYLTLTELLQKKQF